MSPQSGAGRGPDPGPRLRQVVRRFDPRAEPVRWWRLDGGVSAQVTAVEVRLPGGRLRKLVVRRYGEADLASKPHVARDEFRLLGILHAAGLPVPRPHFADESGTILPRPYLVAGYIEGEPVAEPDDVAAFAARLAGVLAGIHGIRAAGHDLSFLPGQHERFGQRLAERPARLDESLSESRVRAALARAWPPERRNEATVLHGDFWPGNTLWRGGELVGVIDWEDAATGDPLADLANGRLEIAMFLGAGAMSEFTRHYRGLMGSLDYASLPCWDLCAALRPAGKMSSWGLRPATLKKLSDGHRMFVNQALQELTG